MKTSDLYQAKIGFWAAFQRARVPAEAMSLSLWALGNPVRVAIDGQEAEIHYTLLEEWNIFGFDGPVPLWLGEIDTRAVAGMEVTLHVLTTVEPDSRYEFTVIDNIRFSTAVVPEPSVSVMLLLGAVFLLARPEKARKGRAIGVWGAFCRNTRTIPASYGHGFASASCLPGRKGRPGMGWNGGALM